MVEIKFERKDYSNFCPGTTYVPFCNQIIGTKGSLKVDDSHTNESCDIPIDTMVVGIDNQPSEYDEIGAVAHI